MGYIIQAATAVLSFGYLVTSYSLYEALNSVKSHIELKEKIKISQHATSEKALIALQDIEELKSNLSKLSQTLDYKSMKIDKLEEELLSLKVSPKISFKAMIPILLAGGGIVSIYLLFKYLQRCSSNLQKMPSKEESPVKVHQITFNIEKDHFVESLEDQITSSLETFKHPNVEFVRVDSEKADVTIFGSDVKSRSKISLQNDRFYLSVGLKIEKQPAPNEVSVRCDSNGKLELDKTTVDKLIRKLHVQI